MQLEHALKNLAALHIISIGMTQGDAARILGVASARISILCNGKPGKFSKDKLVEILATLGADLDSIFEREGRLKSEAVEKAQEYSPKVITRKAQPTRQQLLGLLDDVGDSVAWRHSGKGRQAGRKVTTVDGQGYRTVTVLGVMMAVHRVLWVMRHGPIPQGGCIDHIDGDRLNNARGNLRLTTVTGNNWNRSMNSKNTSGVKGVCWNKKCGKWQAQIEITGSKNAYLGLFDEIEEAEIVVRLHRKKLHGEYTNHGEPLTLDGVVVEG